MKIAHIAAGAAGMYCGTCMHNNTLASALIRRGHDVALVPMYTPPRTDEANVALDRVFFGAINVYLQQKLAFFRHTPRLLDWLLDRPGLLGWVSRFSSSTDARTLGEMTRSLLEGELGPQRKELERLVGWLRDDFQPDLVHLSLSLFLGFARRIKDELGVPIVCSLQGEDLFFDDLQEPYRSQVLAAVHERTRDVDAFTVPCRFYAERMSADYGFPAEKIHVTPLGINPHDFRAGDRPAGVNPVTIGYLARICPEKGLHQLLEAFRLLAEELGPEKIRLRVAGYLGEGDRPYFEEQRRLVGSWKLAEHVDFVGEVDRQGKVDFLSGLDAFSVPTVYKEPKGLFLLEALASGVPVVQPDHGAFPELIAATGGGVLVEPDSPAALAAGIRALIDDPERRRELGERGRAAVVGKFHDEAMADGMLGVYQQALGTAV